MRHSCFADAFSDLALDSFVMSADEADFAREAGARSCTGVNRGHIEGTACMANEQLQHAVPVDLTHRPVFSASVSADPEGGWRVLVTLSPGVTLTKWFEHEDDASGYGEKLAALAAASHLSPRGS
jgi:hypothetical protein